MTKEIKIGFAGTDARTLLSAITVSTAKSETDTGKYRGVVIRGTTSMPELAKEDYMDWPIDFIPVQGNSVQDYAQAIKKGLETGELDFVLPLPEALLFNGLLDELEKSGQADFVAGLNKVGAFIEGDKIECKRLCQEFDIPVADRWEIVDAKSYSDITRICLEMLHQFGGAVLKYPYSAGGKGARVVLNVWELKEVYDALIKDYKKDYKKMFKNSAWPLLIESRMSGVEISFTILVDKNGNFQVLPTSMDYPERFAGTADKNNPITGGMGSISPHPFESQELLELVSKLIAQPLIKAMQNQAILRPCVLYPGCFVSFALDQKGKIRPTHIRVCEINIRPGEPEFQTVLRRVRNLGQLIKAMFEGTLDQVDPEVRQDQISLCLGLVTGPGGTDRQKGYPWSVTKYEPVEFDLAYLKKKNIQLLPSGMGFDQEKGFYSDGTRVAYLNANATVKPGQSMGQAAETLRNKLYNAFDADKVKVIPREAPQGNRLDLRRDIGLHYQIAEDLFSLD